MIFEKFKYILNNKSIRNGGLFSVFSFFNKGVSFVLLIILADYITPEEYGELGLFNTIVMFLGYFIGLSTTGYLSVSYFKTSESEFKQSTTSIILITVVTALLIGSLPIIAPDFLSEKLKLSSHLLIIGVLISFGSVFYQLGLEYERVQEKVIRYGLLSCTYSILNFTLSIYLIAYANFNWEGRVYAQFTAESIYFIITLFTFYRANIFYFPKWEIIKKTMLWGIPLIPHHASVWIKSGLDRYIIESSHTMSDVGLFSFAMNLSSVILTIGVAFNQTNSVNLYHVLSSKESKEKKVSILKKREKLFSIIYTTCGIIVMIGGWILLPLILKNYSGSVYYFIILSVSSIFNCLYFVFCNYLFYFNKTKEIMCVTFGTSAFHLVLSLLLTPLSIYYTCGIYVLTQFIIAIIIYRLSRKCFKLI